MDKDAALRARQGEKLKQARRDAGYRSARDAALSNRWPESTYRAHEGGKRTIGLDDAERYSRKFRSLGATITAKQILFDEGERQETLVPVRRPALIEVPVLSWVSAGRLVDTGAEIPAHEAQKLTFTDLGRGEFFALKVDGDSMDRISPDGSVIVVNRADRTLIAGRCYIFSIRGETTYKRWQGGDPPYLEPYSTNHIHKPIFPKRRRDLEIVGRVRRTLLDL